MPEVRYEEGYTYPKDMPAEDKVAKNAKIKRIPYEVSDEELAMEAAEKTIEELGNKKEADLTTTDVKKLAKALAKLR